jgi:tungstate transport system permease protein
LAFADVVLVDPSLSHLDRAFTYVAPTDVGMGALVRVPFRRRARTGVIVSVIAGFGSIISEVGAVMLVGGNIQGSTRVLTTAIVLQTRMGAFDLALALSFVLLGITFVLNGLVLLLQGGVRPRG